MVAFLLFSAAMALADLTLLRAELIDFCDAVIPARVVSRFMLSAPELLLVERGGRLLSPPWEVVVMEAGALPECALLSSFMRLPMVMVDIVSLFWRWIVAAVDSVGAGEGSAVVFRALKILEGVVRLLMEELRWGLVGDLIGDVEGCREFLEAEEGATFSWSES